MATTKREPAASAAAHESAGSNVHEAFSLMATLIYPRIPMRFLDLCAQILQRRQLETVFEERAVQKLCAFPPCDNKLSATAGKFRVSLARKEIYDASHEKQFCSQTCMKKARVLLSKLVSKPPQLVPSVLEVFGTSKPNPFDYEDGVEVKKVVSKAPEYEMRPSIPKAKAVWSKTADLGVVEHANRAPPAQVAVPLALEDSTALRLKENTHPAPPERDFPDSQQAVLIEGFVFPSHKKPLAKKVEKLLNKTAKNSEEDLVVSDSDESEAAGSDAEDASSAGSFELSDFDEDEVVTLEDLPLFSNLWRLFSEWITHKTTLVVAGLPVSEQTEEDIAISQLEGKEKLDAEVAKRHARQVFMERWNSLSLMVHRPLSHVALQLRLTSDRYANRRIDAITESFDLREAIDARNSHQWTCVAVILMLVAHDIKPEELLEAERSEQLKALTKLDVSELQLLLQLFYEVRKDSDIAVDTDLDAAAAEDASLPEAPKNSALSDKPEATCRKCRRSASKCVCQKRSQAPKAEEFSTDQIQDMLQEALVLRDEYEELLQPEEH